MPDRQALAELFCARAEAVTAKTHRAADEAEADRIAEAIVKENAAAQTGIVRAALGIADTGTCVVETDDEETRLATMIPETTVIRLAVSSIVPSVTDIAPWLRERQKDGKISYTSLITGPSRTADIERVGAVGVHGPLAVHIILTEN